MEFKEVIGSRRSIRYYAPWRPVEREKIQTILEAARLASRAVNADWAKAIVVMRHGFGGHPFGRDADVAKERKTGRVGEIGGT